MLTKLEIEKIIADSLSSLALNDQRVLVIIPDATRTMPLPLFFRLMVKHLQPRAEAVDFLVALGTHPAMSEDALLKLVGLTAEEKTAQYADVQLLNHAWKDPQALITIGTIPSAEIAQLSNGLLHQEVPVRLNRLILDYDHLLICGPVFPHEVVGFSGGNKYFFPGIAGEDIIDFTHWLGALITSYDIIGTKDTPVRRVIDRAASFIPRPRHALCSVVTHEGVEGVFGGTPEEAWSAAADLSAQVHVRYVDHPYRQVLSVMPEMYDEIWVGAKGMYKMEPVVADGGELIIYAPHIKEISVVHGALIKQIGYHVRDYFVKQWDQFKHIPWGVLAHSTHLRGVGTYDAERGIEHPRIQVTLATGISEEECRAVNLGYRDPATIDPQAWLRDATPNRLVVPRAGEYLYRLQSSETRRRNMEKANFGFMGLGVMGHMLALNMERHGFRVAGYDIDAEKVKAFGTKYPGKHLIACHTLEEFLNALERPRRIMMMVPAGKPVDAAIASIKPILERGDLLIDGGNTFFTDTERRSAELDAQGIIYIGTGVSGGESGALWGPAIMPGGQPEAWELVKPIFEAIAAKVNDEPCVAYMGPRGAGHYVKMVHNGIEYGDMQLIAEAYDVLHRGLGLSNNRLHEVFAEWNRGELESYLIEITADILGKLDEESGQSVIDLILDEAQQKGTGKWASQNALDLGAPIPTINAAVESRIISAYKDERVAASQILSGPQPKIDLDPQVVIDAVRDALYAAKICSYAQGFGLMRLASQEYKYQLNYGEIARIWRGGCIIRARFLNDIRQAFARQADLTNLLIDPEFAQAMNARQSSLRKVVALAAENGLPVLAFSSALAYYDAYRSARLPANLTQAQRDYFGAHTYQRVDQPRGKYFHTNWTGQGGEITSNVY